MGEVRVKFFSLLRLALGVSELTNSADKALTVKEVLQRVGKIMDREKAALLEEKLFERDGLKEGVIILLNGENILHLKGLLTEVNPGDTLSVFPPGGGG